jgi:metal-dependent hydrolase (beta-lactamase superfamily II)
MKTLECTIFNVEHGFCAFIKSPNNYGLMVDCGSRPNFSPIKWVKSYYHIGAGNISYYQNRRIAKLIVTHLHADHFSDVGSFHGPDADRPKILMRDTESLKFIDEKISEGGDDPSVEVLKDFKKFQAQYNQDVEKPVEWGFDFFDDRSISFADAKKISEDPDKIINNRSLLVGIQYAGKKILIPGDIEEEGWEEAFGYKSIRAILAGTNFFVASHHGHRSGRHPDMLRYTGKPDIYIISARWGDDDTDYQFYSNPENSRGYALLGDRERKHMISTKAAEQSIRIEIDEYGNTMMYLINTPDNLNDNQRRLRARRTGNAIRDYVYAR